MTATAQAAAEELEAFYGLRTVVVPTHRPLVRIDLPDVVFTHQDAKRTALVDEIARVHATGRPVLVGTASVSESEDLAAALVRAGVRCEVLNARNDEAEAAIVARAGEAGAVTISTNMAGRGTDIRLGGRAEAGRAEVAAGAASTSSARTGTPACASTSSCGAAPAGRATRASSRFFVSLEDPLIRRYGVEELVSARHLPARQGPPVESRLLRTEIARAQRIVEDEGFQLRKTLFGYSDIVEKQRRAVQRWRGAVLERSETQPLLAERASARYERLLSLVGRAVLEEVERRLTLLAIDRCWSDHLAELREMREDSVLLAFAGRFPLAEFHHQAGESFQALLDRIEDEVVRDFERIKVTPEGVDWEREGLRGPSATWTYLVGENPFGASGLLLPAGRIGSVAAAAGAPWLVLLQGLAVFWGRRRRRKA